MGVGVEVGEERGVDTVEAVVGSIERAGWRADRNGDQGEGMVRAVTWLEGSPQGCWQREAGWLRRRCLVGPRRSEDRSSQ